MSAVEPTTAAGEPPMRTVLTVPPVIGPVKGWGKGAGTGPPGVGTMTMWVSVAVI